MIQAQVEAFNQFTKTIAINGLEQYVMYIGSWAEFIYSQTGVLKYDPMLRTSDIDVFVPNIRKPTTPMNLPEILKAQGYFYDRGIDGHVRFLVPGANLEIEFLSRSLGQGQIEPYKTTLGVPAQGLRNMEILSNNPLTLNYNRVPVLVPIPAAYVLHKMVINKERGQVHKIEKDLQAIKYIDQVTMSNELFQNQLVSIFSKLTKKQQNKVTSLCKEHDLFSTIQAMKCTQQKNIGGR